MNKPKPTISVALCTCNGSKYLQQQLDSLQAQTLSVDEIICCDDQSTDDTEAIFLQWSTGFSGKTYVESNAKRLGPRQNFEKALNLCSGDLIFLCDQDDGWHSQKVQAMATYMEAHPSADGLFCNGNLMDENGKPLGETMWDALYFEGPLRMQATPDNLLYYLLANGNIATGTALCIRKTTLSRVLPLFTGFDTWHDHWIALVLAASGSLHFLDEPLLLYRVHGAQQVGFPGRGRSNPAFRQAVHETWLKRNDEDPTGLKTTHLAWALLAWERYAPVLRSRLADSRHLDYTFRKMQSDFRRYRRSHLRRLPYFPRKWKLLKHWLKGGEYLRIGWREVVSI